MPGLTNGPLERLNFLLQKALLNLMSQCQHTLTKLIDLYLSGLNVRVFVTPSTL